MIYLNGVVFKDRKIKYCTLQNQNTPLYWAASEGHTEIVSILIKAGGDPNIANKVMSQCSNQTMTQIISICTGTYLHNFV